MTSDQHIREQALDPTRSFIVRAPAGSGKTELLTQRFLKLLTQVEHPQSVLALTFTRKAAQEMRHRILKSLYQAQQEGTTDLVHAQATLQLAREVLARDQAFNWQLLSYPHRLSIQTIDSLCMNLVRQMPMTANLIADIKITDNAHALYRKAAQQMLHEGGNEPFYQTAISDLLHHFDNQYEVVIKILADLLAKRDQWGALLFTPIQLQDHLQQSLVMIVDETLQNVAVRLTADHVNRMVTLARFAASHLKEDHILFHCRELTELPVPTHQHYAIWCGFAALLLTQKNEFRRKIDKSDGFPVPKTSSDPQLYQAMKDNMLTLLEELCGDHSLRQALAQIQILPPPFYSDTQQAFIEALCRLLPLLLAQLQLVFQQENKLDYAEIMLRASTALGTAQEPTDLALRWDYRLEHILVDEFQDTNAVQFSLLEKLTQGWQVDDGRTLFFVGDPMQSIYRFREANVGLFLQVTAQGINDLPITPLTLSANFRSAPMLVDWVNHNFADILPPQADMNRGAIPFSYAAAMRMDLTGDTPQLCLSHDRQVEAQSVVEKIVTLQAQHPQAKIAILVRARQHLVDIIPLLQQKNIEYEAVELEHLSQQNIIQDLLALTKALLHPADTVAWLAILRAPWCGLSLADLHQLRQVNMARTLLENLQDDAIVNTLSEQAQIRVKRLLQAILPCMPVQRFDLSWAVEKTWLALGGSLEQSDKALQDAYHYFAFLQSLVNEYEVIDVFVLDREVQRLFSQQLAHAHAIQIMTIHQAKGLEFDYVLVPGLDRANNKRSPSLLQWKVYHRHPHKHLLLGTHPEKIGDRDAIYDFLSAQSKEQELFEMQRLLYVAVTRARKGWFGFAVMEEGQEEPKANSFLSLLWPQPSVQANMVWYKTEDQVAIEIVKRNNLLRLPLNWQLPGNFHVLTALPVGGEKVNLKNVANILSWQRATGIVMHRLLANAAQQNNPNIPVKPHFWAALLCEQGIEENDLPQALNHITTAVKNVAADPTAHWILAKHHESQAEYPIQTYYQGEFQNIIIDRTFVDENNVRWIIDYKLTNESEENKNAYAQQLNRYAMLLQQFDVRPIRLGLYFPLTKEFVEVRFIESLQQEKPFYA